MKLHRTPAALALTLAALLGSQAALAAEQVETRLQPGPYALYLQHKGMSQDQALAETRGVGEAPQRQTLRVVVPAQGG
ncbi:hypothetical protein [uncultured Aquincola sp.]|uniref:hypothetical protein n=1 Tax=uncultured Aquincola sp. TaxID=886556 RepID=UPI0032B30BEE